MTEKQKITFLWVRHGQSKGNVDEMNYALVGDPNVELTDCGWQQALSTGQFLKKYYQQNSVNQIPRVFISPYMRTKQTFSGITHHLKDNFEEMKTDQRVFENTRLIEQNFGLLSHFLYDTENKHDKNFVESFKKYSKSLFKKNSFGAQPPLGTSIETVCNNLKSFMDGTIDRDVKQGFNNFLFITHGRVIKSALMEHFHVPLGQFDKILKPNNADVFEISGYQGEWSAKKIYDGPSGEEVDVNPIMDVVYTTYQNLPKIPNHLKME